MALATNESKLQVRAPRESMSWPGLELRLTVDNVLAVENLHVSQQRSFSHCHSFQKQLANEKGASVTHASLDCDLDGYRL